MAPAEDDVSIEEKRVYAGRAGRTDAYVAADIGVVRVAISGDKIGSFGLVSRDPAVDVAVLPATDAAPTSLAVATGDDLLVASLDGSAEDGGSGGDDLAFVPAGVGPAVAVGVDDGAFLVAGADGAIARVGVTSADVARGSDGNVAGDDDAGNDTAGNDTAGNDAAIGDTDGDDTPTGPTLTAEPIGRVPDPRAVDGPLIAAADGVFRVVDRSGDPAIEHVGLDDARDVAGAGVPLAATSTGLYWLGNGWMDALSGSFDAVTADGDGHAMAAAGGDLRTHDPADGRDERGSAPGWGPDAWRTSDLPVAEEPAALGYGPGASVVVTAAGTLCVDVGDGWRHQALGVQGVSGVALTPEESAAR